MSKIGSLAQRQIKGHGGPLPKNGKKLSSALGAGLEGVSVWRMGILAQRIKKRIFQKWGQIFLLQKRGAEKY